MNLQRPSWFAAPIQHDQLHWETRDRIKGSEIKKSLNLSRFPGFPFKKYIIKKAYGAVHLAITVWV
jgi:hypothetical protein